MPRSPERRESQRHERDRRDDRGGHRRRSRSRERHHNDHDRDQDNRRHRDRSHDRYAREDRSDRHHRRDRGDRERDKKRYREDSPSSVRERHTDRYRDSRDLYDDRDRKRPRHGDSARTASPSSSRPASKGDSNPRHNPRDHVDARLNGNRSPPPPRRNRDPIQDEEFKRAERLAKVQAMKQEFSNKNVDNLPSPISANSPISTKAGASQSLLQSSSDKLSDLRSPSPASDSKVLRRSTQPINTIDVSRRAAAALAKVQANALGGDIVVPKTESKVSTQVIPQLKSGKLSEAKITGFGLSKAPQDKAGKQSAKTAAGLEDDEDTSSRRKISKLPPADLVISGPTSTLRYDDPEYQSLDDEGDEEQPSPPTTQDQLDEQVTIVEEKDDVDDFDDDPLDAFMKNLETPATEEPDLLRDLRQGKKKGPQLFNSDDEDGLDAVGDGNDNFSLVVKKKKKDIPKVDHSKIQYEDFRKNFYSESIELAEMTKEEVEELRAELDNITVHGTNIPKPISGFTQGGFGAQILDVIRELKYEKPTAIQAQALPAIMLGRDTIGVAKTGSGKTMAYLLPMFRHVKDQRPVENLEGPVALVLAPTRELAVQIHRDCKPFVKALRLRAVCAYGGPPISDQIAELKRGAEIVVATPGRMIDLLAANAGRVTNLRRVTYLVMDEADRMFDMGFEPQVSRILNNIRPNRQTVLFSATFPKVMEALARKALTQPVEILVGGRSVVAPEIEQIVEIREQKTKFMRLLELLGDNHKLDDESRSLVFVERQETADDLFKQLTKSGYPVRAIHGGRDQVDRDQNIADFKAGHIPVLVATSVAARGLDVKQLTLVVNFDCPNHNEDYVHRCGRTGRAGNSGLAVTFVTPDQDRFAPFLVKALQESKKEVPGDLQKLAEEFKKKLDSGEAKKAHHGFGGRGIERLENARKATRASERKLHQKSEEGDEENEEEDENEASDKKQSSVDKLVAQAASSVKARDETSEPESLLSGGISSHIAQVLKDAMTVHKTAAVVQSSNNTSAAANKLSATDKLSAAVAAINNRLGGKGSARPGAPVDNRGPDAGAFHANLEINDLPQKARWAVTNRTNVAKVLEATGTSITTKGNYYPPGVEPQPDQLPKLYILVEGDTKDAVETAMRELTARLREGLVADQNAKAMSEQAGGRYSVV